MTHTELFRDRDWMSACVTPASMAITVDTHVVVFPVTKERTQMKSDQMSVATAQLGQVVIARRSQAKLYAEPELRQHALNAYHVVQMNIKTLRVRDSVSLATWVSNAM